MMSKERLEEINNFSSLPLKKRISLTKESIKKELKANDYHMPKNININTKYLLEIIEQAERVEELEKVIGDLDENVAAFETLWLEEKRKKQRYKQALEFYANEENYEPSEVQIGAITKEGYKISRYKYDPKINIDNGGKARQALKGE